MSLTIAYHLIKLFLQQNIQKMSDEICDYLNITTAKKFDSNHLTEKFAKLDLSKNVSIFEWLFSSMIHQFVVAKCALQFNVERIASDYYRDNVLVLFDKFNCISQVNAWIVLPNVFTPISVMLNISLIVVTIMKMKEHKVCNWLIAYDALCQLFVVAPFAINLIGVIFRYSPIDYRICLITLMASTVASYASILAMYLISIERLLIIIFPIKMLWVKKLTIRRFSLFSVILCTFFGILMNLNVFNVWTIINLPYERWIYCNSGLYSDVLNTVPSYVILSLSIVNYVAIFGTIFWRRYFQTTNKGQDQIKSNSKSVDQSTRKMLRSVFLLSSVLFVGWLITSAARNQITNLISFITPLIVNLFVTDPMAQLRLNTDITYMLIGLITCVPILASASVAPILLLNSCEYRKAYSKLFKRKLPTQIGPLFAQ